MCRQNNTMIEIDASAAGNTVKLHRTHICQVDNTPIPLVVFAARWFSDLS